MIDENLDSPLELDHISSINNLSWILGLGGEVNDTNKQILDDNTKLFTSQSDTLKALNENVGIDINGQAKAKAHLANVLDKDENITLGEYLQATGLDKVLDMMQYFLKEDS